MRRWPSLPALFGAALAAVAGERHIDAARGGAPGERLETRVLAAGADTCRVRVRRIEDRRAGTWIEARNAAVRAAREVARACCATPRVVRIDDWAAGFTAYEVAFACTRRD